MINIRVRRNASHANDIVTGNASSPAISTKNIGENRMNPNIDKLIPTLPDFILIRWANNTIKYIASFIDAELEARYDSLKEELEPYENELPF
jgi:hypothetical protein